MKKQFNLTTLAIILAASFLPLTASAHCDTMDGPLVPVIEKSLKTGNLNPTLAWIKPEYEAEIKELFDKTLAEKSEAANHHFMEEVVRAHRMGEGESFTGIKPSGTEIEPIVAASDKAILTGDLKEVFTELNNSIQTGVTKRFEEVQAKKNFNPDDVRAGREYVESYVQFIHQAEIIDGLANQGIGFLESLHKDTSQDPHHNQTDGNLLALAVNNHDAGDKITTDLNDQNLLVILYSLIAVLSLSTITLAALQFRKR